MFEVTDEMVDAAALAFTNKPTETVYVIARRMLKAALETHEANKPKPEPYGYVRSMLSDDLWLPQDFIDGEENRDLWIPLYTHPQPKREPLSEEILAKITHSTYGSVIRSIREKDYAFARAIEQAHGIGVK